MKFWYVGDEPVLVHPALGALNWQTKVEPTDAKVAKALSRDSRFKQVEAWDEELQRKPPPPSDLPTLTPRAGRQKGK